MSTRTKQFCYFVCFCFSHKQTYIATTDINSSQIAQEDSWSPLLITEELFRRLLTVLNVHPRFLDVVHVFGEKVTAFEESFTACFTRISPELSSSKERGYGTIHGQL